MLLRYTWRELRNSPRFCLLFILNLSLGLLGFIALDALKRSFADRLEASARSVLTADLAFSTRRNFVAAELTAAEKLLPPGSVGQDVLTLYSMVSSASRSALVELRAIEQGYPFYGFVRLEQGGVFQSQDPLPLQQTVWLAPELQIQLDVKVGDSLKIGSRDFKIADLIADDSSAALVGTSMAPRVYLSTHDLEQSDLIKLGSTVWRSRLYKLPPTADLAQVKTSIDTVVKDPSTRVRTYRESGQDEGRLLNYLSDYLGLVSLVALALAAIGASYLFRVYLARKQSAIAILVSLGMRHERASLLYLMQLVCLGLASALVACVLSAGLMPIFLRLLARLSPIPLEIGFSWQSYGLALLLGSVGAVLVCLPLLSRIRQLNPSSLFHEQGSDADLFQKTSWLAYLPSLLAFYGLAVWQAHSLRVGSLFVAVLAVIIVLFVAAALLLLRLSRRFRRSSKLGLRLAATYLHAHRSHTISSFVALGVGASLINLIPQIQHSIQSELQQPAGGQLPSLFIFDVQDEQIEPLVADLKAQGLAPQAVSPMIMGRLTAINDKPYQKIEEGENFSRESEQEQRSRNRGVNLSYRTKLAPGEEVVSGQYFSRPFTEGQKEPIELSLEERYAERLGLKIGDSLTFDIQGLPISGRITSLRSVKWNTFQPNFFILIQPGSIDDAPKSFLLALPEMAAERQARLQKQIVELFPNVSMIDVSKLVKKIGDLVQQMSLVLIVMGWITVVAGNFVVFSIAHQQALSRRWDHNLLKVLGAELSLIMRATLLEFALLGSAAAVLGSLIGIAASFIIAKVVFRGLWVPSLGLPLALSGLLLVVCLLTTLLATRQILGQKPSLQVDES